jgi:transcriptional regulator with XRE-family HTH domain
LVRQTEANVLQPPEGAKRPAEVLAHNVRDYRSLRRLKQRDVAERMRKLGNRWHPKTVSLVESGGRPVTTDELVALALVLEVTVADLLDPEGADERGTEGYYLGDVDHPAEATYLPLPHSRVVAWSAAPIGYDGESVYLPRFSPYRQALERFGIVEAEEDQL